MSRKSRATATASVMVDIQANASQAKAAADSFVKSLDKINIGASLKREIRNIVKDIDTTVGKLETRATKGISSKTDRRNLLKDYGDLQLLITKLQKKTEGIAKMPSIDLISTKEIEKITKAQKALADFSKLLEKTRKNQSTLNTKKQEHRNKRKELELESKKQIVDEDEYRALKSKKSSNKANVTKGTTKLKDKELELSKTKIGTDEYKKVSAEVEKTRQQLEKWKKSAEEAGEAFSKVTSKSRLDKLNKELEETQGKIEKLSGPDLDKLIGFFKEIEVGDFSGKSFDEISQSINKLSDEKIKQVSSAVKGLEAAAASAGSESDEMGDKISNAATSFDRINAHEQDVTMLTNQMREFFSFTNGIYIFRQAVRDAISTVRELDAAMTETAVVTDYSISDMWKQLPEYTKKANELGATTKGVYETMTLYFQQGLSQQQAFAVGEETLKMARIAGLDYADATNLMTSALRGFNMEINETSAKRINDVYSELAAITAADTGEIATAMTKTASIANSANMSFENTSAFLSQIIETTREAPETAGTALKTIIARFSEVKKMIGEGTLTGVDGEGEAIEINKIDTALQAVGISLKDFISGEKGLDEIFLQLAAKWDTLSVATQRYIATTAAGSRQQSRFLAMMGDYDRTVELVDAAKNAEGSSQRQFEKTLDSLEAKTNRLTNAWDEFTMGIANNEVIKGTVDVLTNLLNVVNKTSDAMGNGLASSFAKVAIGLGALKTGGNVVDRLLENYSQFREGKVTDRKGNVKEIDKKRAGSAAIGSVKKTTIDIFEDTSYYAKRGLEIGKQVGQSIKAGMDSFSKGEFFKIAPDSIRNIQKETKAIFTKSAKESHSLIDKDDFDALKQWRAEYGSVLKLIKNADVGQQAIFTELLSKGNDLQVAKLAIENEITEELLQQIALKELGEKADKKSINNRVKELQGINSSSKSGISTFGNILNNKGVIGAMTSVSKVGDVVGKVTSKIPGLGGALSGIGAKFGEMATSAATAAGATEGAVAAFSGMASALPGIGMAIVTVTASFMAIKALFEWFYANSYEGKIEAAETRANDAAFAAEAAKKSYDDLLESQSTQSGLLSELENLSVGTAEFNQKLLEANSLVDELIGKNIGFTYDDVKTDPLTGAKSFTDEAWARVTKEQGEKSRRANAALTLAEMGKKNVELEQAKKEAAAASARVEASQTSNTPNPNSRGGGYQTGTNPYNGYNNSETNQSLSNTANKSYSQATPKESKIASEIDNYQKQIMTALETETVKNSGKIGEGVKEFYSRAMSSETMDETINNKKEEIKKAHSKVEDLQKLYADAYSIDIKDIDESIKEDKDKLATGIANANILEGIQKQMEASVKSLSATGGKKTRSFLAALGNKGMDVSADDLKNINSLKESEIKKIAKGLNTDVDSVNSLIKEIQTNAARDQANKIENINKTISKAKSTFKDEGGAEVEALNKLYNNLVENYNSKDSETKNNAIDKIMALDNITSSIANADNSTTAGVMNIAANLDDDKLKSYGKFISQINFDSAIEGASQLKAILQSGSNEEKEWAKQIQKSGEKMFSNASQMREYFDSADFATDVEKLNEEISETGTVGSKHIRDLAASGGKLGQMLKNTGMSAETLARIFPKLQTGEIQLDKISDAALEAMSSVQSLNDVVESTNEWIDNFDYGIDAGKGAEFIGNAYKKLNDLVQNGAVGNPQIKTTLSNIFGPNFFEGIETKEGYLQKINSGIEALKNNSVDLFDSWSKLSQKQDVFGDTIESLELFDKTFERIQQNADGGLDMSFKSNLSTEEIINNIAKMSNTSDKFASIMLEDFLNNSPDLAMEFEKNQRVSSARKFAGQTFEDGKWDETNKKVVTTKESIEALALANNTTSDEMKKTFEELGVSIDELGDNINFGSADNPLGIDDFKGQVEEAIKQATGSKFTLEGNVELEEGNILQNYQAMLAELEKNHIQITPEISAAAWESAKQELINSANNGMVEIDGMQVPVSFVEEAGSVEELRGKIDQLKIEGSSVAAGVKDALTSVLSGDESLDINLKVDEKELEEAVSKPAEKPVKLVPDNSDPTTNAISTGKFAVTTQPQPTQPAGTGQATTTQQKVELLPNITAITNALKVIPPQTIDLKVGKNEVKTAAKTPLTQKVVLEVANGGISQLIGDTPVQKTVDLLLGKDNVTTIAKTPVDKTVNLRLGNNSVGEGGAVDKTVNLRVGSNEATAEATKQETKQVNLALGNDGVTTVATATATKSVSISTSTDSVYKNLSTPVTKTVNVITNEKKRHARGIKNSSDTHAALVGEEGPELIQKRNYAYIAGKNGPEFTQIEKGDTVYTAKETKGILRNESDQLFPRYATGYGNRRPAASGGGGGGSSNRGGSGGSSGGSSSNAGDQKEPWKNSFDKLYNLLEDIAEEQRNQTRLQNQYKDLLADENTTGYKLFKNLKEQMASLKRQEELQKQVVSGRQNQMKEWLSQKSQFSQYGSYNWNDMTIEINWDKINSITDQDLGGDVQEYISQLEEWQNSMDSANDELRNIKEAIDELNKTGQNEFLELEQSLFDAVKEQEQKRIDELTSINDSINSSNDKLLSSLRDAIDEERRDRENKKTEESIADKERRLDYLKQDTSGANALAIKKLEEEIANDKENYTDTLIDQKISELEQQNDEAAEQRERQISIAQANLDHMVEFGKLWTQVNGIYDDVLNANGAIDKNSPAYKLLQELAGYKGMSDEQKKQWEEEIQNQATQAVQYLSGQNQLEKKGVGSGQTITFTNSDGQKLTGVTDGKGNVVVTDANKNKWTYSDVYQGRDGEYRTLEGEKDANYQAYVPPKPPAPPKPQKPDNSWRAEGVAAAIWIYGANSGWGNDPFRSGRLQEKGVQNAQYIINTQGDQLYSKWWPRRNELPNYFYGAFKTGGLADFTGPAWLDGTKSKPELVLNQTDTQNFIQLKNVLAEAMRGKASMPNNQQTIAFNINVEVDKISNDYDVDDMVDRIKDKINDDAMYRNINSINLIR